MKRELPRLRALYSDLLNKEDSDEDETVKELLFCVERIEKHRSNKRRLLLTAVRSCVKSLKDACKSEARSEILKDHMSNLNSISMATQAERDIDLGLFVRFDYNLHKAARKFN